MFRHLSQLSWPIATPTSLTTQLLYNYVMRYTPKRSPFDKTAYNQQWIPRQKLYHKSRKPRLPQWSDPQVVYPKMIPPMYKPCSFKHYVRTVIEEEEREKAVRSKEYLLADIRSGDIVELTFQDTFESSQTVTYRGFVLSFKRKRSWSAAIELAIRFGGMPIKCIFPVNSPKVKKIELVSRGSGCFKANLKDGWQKMNKVQLTTPKIKKRVMKSRVQGRKRKTVSGKKSAGVKYDQVATDSVKRLI